MLPQPLDVPTAIRQRRAIKSFQATPLAPETITQLVELTVAAPSSYNLQDWQIILVQDPQQKAALAAAAHGQAQVSQAPVTFVFAADSQVWATHLPLVLQQAQALGAWPEATIAYFHNQVPQFQASLGPKAREYAVKDAMIAATHLALAAESLGLATCLMNGWDEQQVKQVIGAANNPTLAIAVLVAVGYPALARQYPGRLPLAQNVFLNHLGQPYPVD